MEVIPVYKDGQTRAGGQSANARRAERREAIVLFGAIVATAACFPILAVAQEQPQNSQGVVGRPVDAPIDEVVVTAQRRSERIETVPVTITSLGAGQLRDANINSTEDLQQVVPAFQMNNGGNFAQPSIRGVTTTLDSDGAATNVAVYVDGYYDPSPISADFDFGNIQDIEVLKGPQGTLFGRNTTGGAIVVTSKDPSQDQSIQGEIKYGNFNALAVKGYGTTGLGPNLAADLSVIHESGDGFLTNLANGDDTVGRYDKTTVRAGLKYSFDNDDSLVLHYTHTDNSDPTYALRSPYRDSDGRYETVAYAFGIPAVWGINDQTVGVDPDKRVVATTKIDQVTLTGKFDLGFADLTSYTQYRDERNHDYLDTDSTSAQIFDVSWHLSDEVFTQELLFSSKPGERLSWVAGAFFMNQDAVFQLDVPYPALGPQYVNGLTVNSYAAYGDATYAVTDALFLTFGARVGLEGNDGFWRCLGATPTNAFCPGAANLNHTWRNLSPRAVIRYALTPDSNVYASITRGYKAGLINVSGFQEDPIGAERITSYEVGYKLAANNTRFSASGFYYDYKGLQSEFYTETTNVITNAASSEIYGGEASITQNIGNFSTTVGVAYTHAIYLDYPGAPSSTFDFATGTVSTTPVNASGKTLLAAPRWSGNIGATYTIPAAVFEGDVALNANLYFTSRNYFDATDVHYQNSYQLLNLRATWTSEDERYSLALWGNNVTGTQYLNQAGGFGYATGVTYGAPPTYGATFGFKFR